MAHKTKIDATNFEVIGGKAMINGTAFDISKGSTMVNGTVYGIEFEKDPEPVPEGMVGITITNWEPPCGKITVNGESLFLGGGVVYAYEPGATVQVIGWSANISFNGEDVAVLDTSTWADTQYTFTLTKNVTIYSDYSNTPGGATIYIETE